MTTTIRNNMLLLAAKKAQTEHQRITLRTIATATGINTRPIDGTVQDTLKQYSKDVLLTLYAYVGCKVNTLLFLVEDDQ